MLSFNTEILFSAFSGHSSSRFSQLLFWLRFSAVFSVQTGITPPATRFIFSAAA
jgi:hypothetical protein